MHNTLVAGISLVAMGVSSAAAQLCGDADGNGSVTVTDGVVLLRAAAELPSPCQLDVARCDVDLTGSITVADGVNVLRAAAGLSNVALCPSDAPITLAPGDRFGESVAILGTTLLIGAPGSAVANFPEAGAVYLLDARTGKLVRRIPNPEPHAGDQFGAAVAGFGYDFAIGAPFDDADGADAGRVYVFERADTLHVLKNPEPHPGDHFGEALTTDDQTMIVVGAPLSDADGEDAGRAYVYDVSALEPRVVLHHPRAEPGARFGAAVAAENGIALIGAPLDDAAATDAGAVYQYELSTAALTAERHDVSQPGAQFGFALAMRNGNVLIGIPFADGASGSEDIGSAVLNSRVPFAPERHAGDQFGRAVALGVGGAYIGAPFADTDVLDAGKFYVDPCIPCASVDLEVGLAAIPINRGARYGFALAAAGDSFASPMGAIFLVGAPFGDTDTLFDTGRAVAFFNLAPDETNVAIP